MTVKVDTRPWQTIRKIVDRLGARQVQVGVFEGDVAKIAAVHEFGAPSANIPERSFIRSLFTDRADELKRMQALLAARVLSGQMSEDTALQYLGVRVRDAIKNRIIEQPPAWPPREPKYDRRQRARGKTKTLIDTGQLIASIVFRIVGRR
jgi:hypothetical protein